MTGLTHRPLVQQGRTGKKIVAGEHAEQNKIVDDALHVNREGQLQASKLQPKVLP